MPAGALVFLGPPGTGKGTQAQRLCGPRGWAALSSGDVLRQQMRAGSPLGRQVQSYVESGTLVPDELVSGVMLAAVDGLTPGTGFVLDGFPRTVPQAETLEQGLARRNLALRAVLDFQLADPQVIERIVNRRVCLNCGATYNLRFLRPRRAGICDQCGAALTQRVDDRQEVIRTRLRTYRSQTAPLIDYYTRRDLLHAVDASADADAVAAEVVRIVTSLDRSG